MSVFHAFRLQLSDIQPPDALQKFTFINPLRFYIIVIWSVFLKGVGVAFYGRIYWRWWPLPCPLYSPQPAGIVSHRR
jgi:hypothetical protein